MRESLLELGDFVDKFCAILVRCDRRGEVGLDCLSGRCLVVEARLAGGQNAFALKRGIMMWVLYRNGETKAF